MPPWYTRIERVREAFPSVFTNRAMCHNPPRTKFLLCNYARYKINNSSSLPGETVNNQYESNSSAFFSRNGNT